ncbi:MAG: hypothetical protein CL769_00100 [Chloroflexi bacterium]|nr:hypothetical protein [Chloroflexota bacterium]|tara:strand:- start:156 stop:506 length:351 start_codon:yes stop_codon:yes gene_type:complete
MIKIEAIIKPEKATAIGLSLEEAGVGGYFLSNVTGKGNQKGVEVTTGRGTTKITRSSVPKTLITTVVDDSQRKKVIEILLENAKTGDGEIGDGKIFITKIDEAIRVRTSETGKEAL